MKTVYVGMCADGLHHGHIHIIQEAMKYGEVIVGLLTDKAIASYKKPPLIKYVDRLCIVANIKGVAAVVPQDSLDYVPNLKKFVPDYLVHGDDWKTGVQKKTRQRVIDVMKKWKGKLVEIPYTENISSTDIKRYWGVK